MSLGDLHDRPHGSKLTNSALTLEFEDCCLGEMLQNHTVILNYRIEHDHITRIDPVALNPQDFVDEWVQQPWEEMRNWSSSRALAALAKWHKQLNEDWILPEFELAQKCRRPGLWQLAVTKEPYSDKPVTRYFLVSEGPGSHYEM